MKFSDILLVTDLDGTYLDENRNVPQRNIEAVKRFQAQGGRFSIATGRSLPSGARYYRAAMPNELCVLLNGALIYDFKSRRAVKGNPLRVAVGGYVKTMMEQFPEAGVEVYTEDRLYVIRNNSHVEDHLSLERLNVEQLSFEQALELGEWYKLLFACDEKIKKAMHSFSMTFEHPGCRFVETSETYLELLPSDVDKGSALEDIIALTGCARENVFAIGDYYNDVEMLRAAGFAAAPADAPEDIKAMADLVAGPCGEGAVADLIEYLERGRLGC